MAGWSTRRISALSAINDSRRYLEIGVEQGATFNSVSIPDRTGVDLSLAKYVEPEGGMPPGSRLHEESSDQFFQNSATGVYDLIFIDGFHTAEQTFRDFSSSLAVSGPSTIWLIDDVVPSSPISAVPDLTRWHQLRSALASDEWQWHGDVYRAILMIRTAFVQFNVATIVDCGKAQTVVWRSGLRSLPLNMGWEQISRYSYFDLVSDLSVLKAGQEKEILEQVSKAFTEN